MSIEEFLKTHYTLAIRIINNSKNRYLLDDDDISEIIHIGLWKSWRSYDSTKSKVNTYITTVIKNMIYDFARKKRKYLSKIKLSNINNEFYNDEEPLFSYFTDNEWEDMQDLSKSERDKLERKVIRRLR